MPAPTRTPGSADPYAVFRPRRGRQVAMVCAVLSVLVFTVGAISLPRQDVMFGGWGWPDRMLLVITGLAIALLLWRYATIRAVPTPERLVVRNLFTTRELEWSEILQVQFGGGAPWVSLDLSDTDTVAVMAIQRADGAFGRAEASRLTALVQVNGGPRTPDA